MALELPEVETLADLRALSFYPMPTRPTTYDRVARCAHSHTTVALRRGRIYVSSVTTRTACFRGWRGFWLEPLHALRLLSPRLLSAEKAYRRREYRKEQAQAAMATLVKLGVPCPAALRALAETAGGRDGA